MSLTQSAASVENRYYIRLTYPKTTIAWNKTTGKPTVTLYHNVYVNGTKTQSDQKDGSLSTDLSFSSGTTSVASVASDGNVTGEGGGTSLITVTYSATSGKTWEDGGNVATETITVTDVTENRYYIRLAYPKTTITWNETTDTPTVTLYHNVYVNGAKTQSGQKDGSLSTDLSFSSDKTSVATVASDGTVTGEGGGQALITVTYSATSGKTWEDGGNAATETITVTDVTTYDLVIEDAGSDISLNVGSSSGIIQAQMYKVVNGERSKIAASMSSPGWDVYTTASGTTASSVVEFQNEFDTAALLTVHAKGKNAGTGYISCHATGPDGEVHTAAARRKVIVSDVVEDKYYIEIALNPTSIYVGEKSNATVKLYYNRYTNGKISASAQGGTTLSASDLTMASSDETVATQSGLTSTGVGPGTTSISATYAGSGSYTWESGGSTASATLTVYSVISVSPTSLSWTATQSGYSNRKTASVSGNSVSIKSCSDEFTASLSGTTLTVYPKNPNTTTSAVTGTVTLQDGGGNTCDVSLTQSAGTVDYKVEITSYVSSMTSGETKTFAAKAYKQVNGGSWTEYSATITWSSSNTSVATVGSSTGAVTAQNVSSSSTATITASATIGGTKYSDSKTVTVNPADVVNYKIEIDNASTAASVSIGGTETFTAKMYKQVNGGSWTESTYTSISWTSDNSAIATVGSSTGVVTGVMAGTTTIGVSAKDEKGTLHTASTKRSVTVKADEYEVVIE